MARYSSDSDSDHGRRRSSKKGKKKSRSRRRSRSSSSDRKRSRDSRRRSTSRSRDSRRRSKSRSRDSRRRSRSRSRSEDSYYSRRRRSSSRSRNRRSRSRSSSRERYSRKRRSRSRSREKSKKGRWSGNRSHSRERSAPKKKSQPPKTVAVKQKDPCEDVPGFAEMTPAQQNRLRVQAAFKALDTEKSVETITTPTPAAETTLEHMERAQVIADIEDEGFMPTHFSSTRSIKTPESTKSSWHTNLIDQEDYHEMAIFGNSGALALDEQSKKQISDAAGAIMPKKTLWKDRDPKSLAHPNLHISKEEADRRWIERLTEMRKQALQAAT